MRIHLGNDTGKRECLAFGQFDSLGLEDQAVGLVARMATAQNVYDCIKAWRKSPNWVKWQAENPDAYRVVRAVIEMRTEADKYAG